ncbi:MAG: GntR family transcriptional regulator [Thermodesulfobacteriota bacterium]|nr:GntR family transcriptional regulator [Thermodesulfobacteriota bacterium]
MKAGEKTFITPPLLVEDVASYLRDSIVNGTLKQGEKLSETSLQKRFGTSRSPIREALRILEREGLVAIFPRRGACVSNITREDLVDTTIVRANLEALAAKLALPHITHNDLKKMERLLKNMEEELKEYSITKFTTTHHEFHETFILLCKNRVLIDILGKLRRQYFRPEVTSIYFLNNFENAASGHLKIVKAFESRDAQEVENVVKDHIITAFSDNKDLRGNENNKTGKGKGERK